MRRDPEVWGCGIGLVRLTLAIFALPATLLIGCGSADNAGSGGAGSGTDTSTGTNSGSGPSSSSTSSSAGGGGAGSACEAGLSAGLAPVPVPFTLPAQRCNTPFDSAGQEDAITYGLLDLDADGRADLVVQSDDCDKSIGAAHWDYYPASDTGFTAAPTPYSVPAARCQVKFDSSTRNGNVSFALVDLTADGRGDLVVFRDGCDPSVGKTHWDVYPAGSTGFAAAPIPYALPAPRCNVHFDAAAASGPLAFALLDLVGDGRPDLVVTADACDKAIGVTRWDVYPGGAAGFGSTAPIAIPAARCNTPFDALAHYGAVHYSLFSLQGGSRPDLVVTSDGCDASVGKTHWDTYPLGPSGFAPAPQPFNVPAPRCNVQFNQAANQGAMTFGLLDLSCDRRPDLVVSSDACDSDLGSTRWDVYPAAEAGFAASPTPLTIPAARCNTPFDALSREDAASFSILALRPGKPQIVVFSDSCDPSVGTSRWDLYPLP